MGALPHRIRKIAALLAVLLAYLGTWCELNHVAFHAAAVERAQQEACATLSAPDPPCPLCELEATPRQATVAAPLVVPLAWLPILPSLSSPPALLRFTALIPPCGRGPPQQTLFS